MKENLKPYVYKQTEHVKVRCRTFCRTVRRVILYGEIKYLRYEVEEKSSLKRARKSYVKKLRDDLWIAEKFQSNSEIAGSPRNSFRTSLVK